MGRADKQRFCVFELCQRTGDMLKAIGFEQVYISRKTEACYYKLPGRFGLLRVSAHRNKHPPIGLDPIASKITFRGNCHSGANLLVTSENGFMTQVYIGIGQYMMRSAEQKPSEYKGKKGTWENAAQHV